MTAVVEKYRGRNTQDLTAEEIETIVQSVMKERLSDDECARARNSKPYLQGRTRMFTLKELCAVDDASLEALEANDEETSNFLHQILPIEPDWLKEKKNFWGKEWVVEYGGDFTPAELKYGKDWLEI
ncbi:hypothetical protein FACS1894139_04440 [Planctomycetales bacterium]|nr:hypothetical protein FACS1894107_02100 [Planctomycetales bacterium]GHT01259.1 hypothetical protein FACS1894108_14780 [Planctomycetales bacterium]GHT03650.1 hypothetical protein FACS1894139_04440 [Planctomycetales bacterium]